MLLCNLVTTTAKIIIEMTINMVILIDMMVIILKDIDAVLCYSTNTLILLIVIGGGESERHTRDAANVWIYNMKGLTPSLSLSLFSLAQSFTCNLLRTPSRLRCKPAF